MVDIRRILCPVDFSDASQHARDHALAIANWYRSQVDALYVLPARMMPTPPLFFYGTPPAQPGDVPREAALARLSRWLEDGAAAGLKTSTLLDEGDPASCILRHAAAIPADLIVMGTHGLTGFDHFVLGSVTEKVLRKASCPVMTVPPQARTAAKVPYARVLCPVDFSESSLTALRFAISLAEEADARLTILHAIDWSANEGLMVEEFDPPELRRRIETAARERLEALVTDDMRAFCRPAITLAYGKPYREILHVAEEEHSDLIVIGVRGRNPVDLAVFGSTTNQVVRRASCPVLTLKD